MEASLISAGIVALAEMGDKTQLLSLVLTARFRKPWSIVFGILVATLANHGLAGALGAWVTAVVGPELLRWLLAASFLAMALWMLVPDKLDAEEAPKAPRLGVFATTVIVVFLAEMGEDAGGDGAARGAVQRLCRGRRRHHARHDDRQRAGRVVW